jgi:hypothetical protein
MVRRFIRQEIQILILGQVGNQNHPKRYTITRRGEYHQLSALVRISRTKVRSLGRTSQRAA